MAEKISPSVQTTSPTTGSQNRTRAQRARTNPAVAIPLVLGVSTMSGFPSVVVADLGCSKALNPGEGLSVGVGSGLRLPGMRDRGWLVLGVLGL